MSTSVRYLVLFLTLVLPCATAAAGNGTADKAFPKPLALAPAVSFWTRVYTDIDTSCGFIHDDRRLDIVYETLRLDPNASPSAQDRAIQAARDRYRKALLTLAAGQRSDLTQPERRALQVWGTGATAAQLKAAAKRVRFQRGQAERFNSGLARAAKWHRRIEAILLKEGLPTELAVLPLVESSYNPKAHSSAGAVGLWQLMPSTASRYLRVHKSLDERLDPYKSSEAAAQLLQHNYSVLGSWPLALTAYNHGLSGMRRATLDTGSDQIAEIIEKYDGDSFGFASRNFYPSFLAALDVSRRPEAYFGKEREKFGPRPLTVRIGAFLPVDAVTDAFGTETRQLRELNPALPRTVWTGKLLIPKGYALRLPPSHTLPAARQKMAQLTQSVGFQAQKSDLYHEVGDGESLSRIAERYGADTQQLVAINHLSSIHEIRAGQILLVASGPQPQPVSARNRAADDEHSEASGPEPGILPVETQPQLAADPADYRLHKDGTIIVQAAETLGHYAEWLGVSSKRLREINRLKRGQSVVIGHRLKLDLAKTTKASFERQRAAYHIALEASYFQSVRIAGMRQHKVQNGDTLWRLAEQRYSVPLWLLRQYNPDIALDSLLPLGGVISVPVLTRG
jgi:peptidoglycan lytic transglycosylase D